MSPISCENLSITDLFRSLKNEARLSFLRKTKDADRRILSPALYRPGLALAGFLDDHPFAAIQIIGPQEQSFLQALNTSRQMAALNNICAKPTPFLLWTNNPDRQWASNLAKSVAVPSMATPLDSGLCSLILSNFLNDFFTPITSLHGTLVDVYGVGMLFIGKTGIGKSECALDLIRSGHQLISDDAVHIARKGNALIGYNTGLIGHHMEIRGLGIVDIKTMYGIRAVRSFKRIDVQVELKRFSPKMEIDRTGLDQKFIDILGLKIPHVTVPVSPGRSLLAISEVVAMDMLLKRSGINSAQKFNRNVILSLKKQQLKKRHKPDDIHQY